MRDVQVVVVDERDTTAKERIQRAPVDMLQMMLADVVSRMGFSREDNLNGPFRGIQNPREPLRIEEDQFRTLVAGEAPRETDRQSFRIEQRPRRDDARRADVFDRPSLTRTLANERKQIVAQTLADAPEFLVGNREHGVP